MPYPGLQPQRLLHPGRRSISNMQHSPLVPGCFLKVVLIRNLKLIIVNHSDHAGIALHAARLIRGNRLQRDLCAVGGKQPLQLGHIPLLA